MRSLFLGLLFVAGSALAARLGPETVVRGPYSLPLQESLRIAIGGDRQAVMVAWTEGELGTARVHAQILGRPNAIAMPRSADANAALPGSIAKIGDTLTLTWREDGFSPLFPAVPEQRVVVARVSADGALLEARLLAVLPELRDTSVLATADGFRVFADTTRTIAYPLSTGGAALGAPQAINAGRANSLIATQDHLAGLVFAQGGAAVPVSQQPFSVQARVCAPDGVDCRLTDFLGSSNLPLLPPAIASNGDGFLVLIHDGHGIIGQRLNGDGSLAGNFIIVATDVAAPRFEPQPIRAVWDGERYLVAWEQTGRGVDIAGAYVTAEGRVKERFAIAGGDADERGPVLVPRGSGKSIAAWQTVDRTTASLVTRTIAGPSLK